MAWGESGGPSIDDEVRIWANELRVGCRRAESDRKKNQRLERQCVGFPPIDMSMYETYELLVRRASD